MGSQRQRGEKEEERKYRSRQKGCVIFKYGHKWDRLLKKLTIGEGLRKTVENPAAIQLLIALLHTRENSTS